MTAESILYIFKFPKVCILIVAFISRAMIARIICILHNLCYTKDTKRAERELDSLVDR